MLIGLGEATALVASFFWALASIAIRPLSRRLPTLAVNAGRSAVAGAFLLLLAPLAGDPTMVPPSAYLLLLGSVVVALGLGDTCYFESIRRIGVARAIPITSAQPLFTTLMAVLLLGESVSPRMLAGILMIVVGVYVVAQVGALLSPLDLFRGPSARGSALVLLASLLWAMGTVMMRPALQHIDVFLANALRMPTAAVLVCLIAWRRGSLPPVRALKGRLLLELLLAGLLAAVSTFTFVVALQLAGAAKTATLSSTAPLWAVPISAILLRERLTSRVIVGTLLSVAGIWLLLGG